MNHYSIQAEDDYCQFSFQSVGLDYYGQERIIDKIVGFQKSEITLSHGLVIQVYNMFLVDELPNGELSDSIRSNNGDLDKILATTAHCVVEFLTVHPDAIVYFKGVDEVRSRLYRIELSKQKNFDLVTEKIDLYGSQSRKVFLLMNQIWFVKRFYSEVKNKLI